MGSDYPGTDENGYAYAHRVTMSEMVGRPLYPEETVHHRNGIKTDNRPENLELWTSVHQRGQRVDDLVAFVLERYRERVEKALADEHLG